MSPACAGRRWSPGIRPGRWWKRATSPTCATCGGVLAGERATLLHVEVEGGAGDAITLGDHSLLAGGLARSCGGNGVQGGQYTLVRDVRVEDAGQSGVFLGDYALVSGVETRACAGRGIRVGGHARVLDARVTNAGQAGVEALGFALLTGLAVENCQTGIDAANDTLVRDCRLSGNAGGLVVGLNSVVSDCDVQGGQTGILISQGVARDNHIHRVRGTGLRFLNDFCEARGNRIFRCHEGIRFTTQKCLVVGNVLMGNHPGPDPYEENPGNLPDGSTLETHFAFDINQNLVGRIVRAGEAYVTPDDPAVVPADQLDNVLHY